MFFSQITRRFAAAASGWPAYVLAGVLLMGTSPAPARQTPPTAPPTQKTATTCPVQASVHGHLTDLFFTTGDRVKRGQLLAKLERPDGTTAYLVAPVAGRIGPAQQHLGQHLPAHATLAVIETSPAR